MKKRKICVVVASRANYGRIKSVLYEIKNHPELELQLIVGASALLHRFGKVIDIIKADGFKVDASIYFVIEGENPTTMAKSTGLAIIELATVLENLKPDIVLTVADRYETLATAVAASYMNIPLAHTQGGEVTGSIDESVRHAITKLAHIHFPTTKRSSDILIKMGEDPKFVFPVGCPSIDTISKLNLDMTEEFINKNTEKGVGANIDFRKPYLIVLQHPVTTEYGEGQQQITQTLEAIYELKMQTVWLWPNVDAGSDDISKCIRAFREKHEAPFLHFYINFPVEEYAIILKHCSCIIGNSSSGIREGSYLGTPCVNIGTRQNKRERGENVIDVNYDKVQIINAINKQVSHGPYKTDYLYGDGKSSKKIVDILSNIELSIKKELHYD